MANRIKFSLKEEDLDSICKLANRENKDYIFFDPDNITGFEAKIGNKGNTPCYLFEFIQTMWGNDEIYEYILLDDTQIDLSSFGTINSGVIKKYNIPYTYTLKKGLFSRYYYNVYFEYKNERYYLFVKTIAPRLSKIIETIKLKEEV